MRPEIEAYLREHGAKYTTKTLRKQLIFAGHDPAEIDAALRETEEARGPQLAGTRAFRSRFWWSAIGLHLAALVVATVWNLTTDNDARTVVVVLGVALLIGLGISGLIGRALLGRGLAVALVVPLLSALLLGGGCIAALSGPVVLF